MRMNPILLINPNSSSATTAMMVTIARGCAPAGSTVTGVTATRSPPMIVSAEALEASADEVLEIGVRNAADYSGIIIGAFGDPGLALMRQRCSIPVVGICEAAMIQAAAGGRRFGVATTTPELAAAIARRADQLRLAHLYTGIRLTTGDPLALTADPPLLQRRLGEAVALCIERDGAQAVIIGGGPLGNAAIALTQKFRQEIIAPIPAAVSRLVGMIGMGP
jgi:Asp/Glu/hydantoin racemase